MSAVTYVIIIRLSDRQSGKQLSCAGCYLHDALLHARIANDRYDFDFSINI